jgi:hypothetical protein
MAIGIPSSYNMGKIVSEQIQKIGAITFRRTHRAGIYKQVNKTTNKKDQFNVVKTLETTIFLVYKKILGLDLERFSGS